MKDNNSALAWNAIWLDENGIKTWRTYPTTFKVICGIVGIGNKVLEVGCGVGLLANKLKLSGNDVTGLDISPFAINTMKQEFGIDGIIHDARVLPLPFPDGAFDWVIATEFLEHFTPEDAEKIVADISRISRRAVFCVPHNTLPPSEIKEHLNIFTPLSLEAMVKKHFKFCKFGGFNDIFETTIDPPVIKLQVLVARCSQTDDTKEMEEHP